MITSPSKLVLRTTTASILLLALLELVAFSRAYLMHRRPEPYVVRSYMHHFHETQFYERLFQPKHLRDIGDIDPSSGDGWKDFLIADSLLGWRNARSVYVTHYRKYVYMTNEQGFMSIGDERFTVPLVKPSGTFRIFVVGGSTVIGQGARTPDLNIVGWLDRKLRKRRPDLKLEIVNAGVGGYNSAQEYLYLASDLARYHPDLVIVYDGWNDECYGQQLFARYGQQPRALQSVDYEERNQRLNDTYKVAGAACILSQAVVIRCRQFVEGLALKQLLPSIPASRIAESAPPGSSRYEPGAVEYYRDNLDRIIDLAARKNFRLALFLQPIMGIDGKPAASEEALIAKASLSDLPQRLAFYRDARAMFARLTLSAHPGQRLCIRDLSQTFRHDIRPLYADSGHLNPAGNARIADAMIEALEDCRVLPASASGRAVAVRYAKY